MVVFLICKTKAIPIGRYAVYCKTGIKLENTVLRLSAVILQLIGYYVRQVVMLCNYYSFHTGTEQSELRIIRCIHVVLGRRNGEFTGTCTGTIAERLYSAICFRHDVFLLLGIRKDKIMNMIPAITNTIRPVINGKENTKSYTPS